MINIKPQVVAALKNNVILTGLLGGPRVYFQCPPDPAEFPRITYYILGDEDTAGSKDGAGGVEWHGQDIQVSIDIWAKGSTSAIETRVDEILKGIVGYWVKRIRKIDLFEKDTMVYHSNLVYSFKYYS